MCTQSWASNRWLVTFCGICFQTRRHAGQFLFIQCWMFWTSIWVMKKGHNLNLPYKKRTILSLKKIMILFSFRHRDNEYKHFPLQSTCIIWYCFAKVGIICTKSPWISCCDHHVKLSPTSPKIQGPFHVWVVLQVKGSIPIFGLLQQQDSKDNPFYKWVSRRDDTRIWVMPPLPLKMGLLYRYFVGDYKYCVEDPF